MNGEPVVTKATCVAGSDTVWCTLQNALDGVVAFAWPAATALAGVGILTMALIEIADGVGRLRARFRRKHFRKTFIAQFPKTQTKTCEHAQAAFNLLEHLIAYGDPLSNYDEDLATLTSRMSAAFRTMLGNATTYEDALIGLAPRIDSDTLATLKAGPGTDVQQKEEFTQAKAMAMGLNQHFLSAVAAQLELQWSRTTQRTSVLISIGVIGLCATIFYWNRQPGQPTIYFWIIIAIFGGTVAPVAKNIVTALKNVKNRTR